MEPQYDKELRTLSIISIGFIVQGSISGILFYFLAQQNTPQPELAQLISPVFFLVSLVSVTGLMFLAQRRLNAVARQADLLGKLREYRSIVILRMVGFVSSYLLMLVGYYLTRSTGFLLGYFVAFAGMFWVRGSLTQFEQVAQLTPEERKALDL